MSTKLCSSKHLWGSLTVLLILKTIQLNWFSKYVFQWNHFDVTALIINTRKVYGFNFYEKELLFIKRFLPTIGEIFIKITLNQIVLSKWVNYLFGRTHSPINLSLSPPTLNKHHRKPSLAFKDHVIRTKLNTISYQSFGVLRVWILYSFRVIHNHYYCAKISTRLYYL